MINFVALGLFAGLLVIAFIHHKEKIVEERNLLLESHEDSTIRMR